LFLGDSETSLVHTLHPTPTSAIKFVSTRSLLISGRTPTVFYYMEQLWLITVPNNKQSADSAFATIQGNLSQNGSAQLYRFEIPNLVVGTLDTLMVLSDDLMKIGSQIEVLSIFF
jgi:hypothetical protein